MFYGRIGLLLSLTARYTIWFTDGALPRATVNVSESSSSAVRLSTDSTRFHMKQEFQTMFTSDTIAWIE